MEGPECRKMCTVCRNKSRNRRENLPGFRETMGAWLFKDVEKKKELKSPEIPHPWETQHMPSPPPKNAGVLILQTPASPSHVVEAGGRVSSP